MPSEVTAEADPAAEQNDAPVDAVQATDAPAEETAPEMEVFYTFAWGGRASAKQGGRGGDRNGGQNRNANKARKGDKPNAGKGGDKQRAQKFSAKPEKKAKIDPDNPFAAALMGLNKG